MPAGLDRALWYDLSPMRPDEFGRQRADRWYEALALRRAYNEGIAQAKREAGTAERTRQRAMRGGEG